MVTKERCKRRSSASFDCRARWPVRQAQLFGHAHPPAACLLPPSEPHLQGIEVRQQAWRTLVSSLHSLVIGSLSRRIRRNAPAKYAQAQASPSSLVLCNMRRELPLYSRSTHISAFPCHLFTVTYRSHAACSTLKHSGSQCSVTLEADAHQSCEPPDSIDAWLPRRPRLKQNVTVKLHC